LRVCVTGASGFIGSNLVSLLEEKRFEVIKCDPRDPESLSADLLISKIEKGKVDAVIHLGAISSTVETDTVAISTNNILLSCRLLEKCITEGVPFSYASSASVYGSGELGFSEAQAMTPLNYYSISKASFDSFVLRKIKDNPDAKIFGMRYFNVYGSNEAHKKDMASPVYKFFDQSLKERKIRLFEGSENFKRDFIHVKDAAQITIDSIGFKESGIYNVGTGDATSFKEVAQIIAPLLDSEIIEIPFPVHLKEKYQVYTCSDNAKISKEFTKKRISISEGIRMVAGDLLDEKFTSKLC